MRTLRQFLYFTALCSLLLGVTDCISLALGGATADSFLAGGFVLLALGLGARFQGVGYLPLRASFLLLGLAGGLPLLAGFAPLGAAFSAFLFLPIRALGARISTITNRQPSAISSLALGGFFAWLFTAAWAPGLPGFLLLWVTTGILQRIVLPPAKKEIPSPAPRLSAVAPSLFAGAGAVLLFLFLSPYFTLFDSGALPQDLRRAWTLGLVFFLSWFTFGSGFAETRWRPFFAASSALALALCTRSFALSIEHLSSAEGYYRWLTDSRLHSLLNFNAPVLPEEHPLYVPILSLVAFAVPCALLAFLLRTLVQRETPGVGPNTLAPLLGGAGVTLLACGLLAPANLFPKLQLLAPSLLVLSSLSAWWTASQRPLFRGCGYVGIALLLSLFLLPVPPLTMQHPLVDVFVWTNTPSPKSSRWPQTQSLQTQSFFSLPQYLRRNTTNPEDTETHTFLFDARNTLTPPPSQKDTYRVDATLAAALAGNPEQVCWVGVPNRQLVDSLCRDSGRQLTLACDPPSLAHLAMLNPATGVEQPSLAIQRNLTRCDGPFGLVFLHSSAMWESRHSILRAELLRQASLRLSPEGSCVFVAAPEDFAPGMLPQWIQEFKEVFAETTVFLLPGGANHARIMIAGRPSSKDGRAWGLPNAEQAQQLLQWGLPIYNQEDLASIELHFPDYLSTGHRWMFRGPFRPADAALSATAFRLVAENSVAERATQVLTELQRLELPKQASLLDFYVAQFAAQQYSVHDTYFGGNPLAVEVSAAALDALMKLTIAHPQAAPLHRTWGEMGVVLVELREIPWIEDYFGRLWQDLHWQDVEIRLALAHAALETLDFEGALEHIHAVLAQVPDFRPALELQRLAEHQEQVPRDAHAGHNHGRLK